MGGYFAQAFPENFHGHRASLVTYGVFSGLAAVFTYFLADPVGFALPEDFDDVRRIRKHQKPLFSCVGADWVPGSDSPKQPE